MRWFQRTQETNALRAKIAAPPQLRDPAKTPDNLVFWIRSLRPTSPQPERQEGLIGRLLADLSVGDVRRLDVDMRWRESWQTHSWNATKPAEAAFTIRRASDQVVVAAGFSMHPNGHIRELAVNALAGTGDERAMPWLALRSGDWVKEVSVAALDGIGQFLNPMHASRLVQILPLLDGGRFGKERAADDLPQRVERILGLPESSAALRSGVASTDTQTRRASVRLLLRQGSGIDLLGDVMVTNDPVAVAMVASSIPSNGPLNLAAGRLLIASPIARFRSQGLWRLTRNNDEPDLVGLVQQALFDKAQPVRDVARRWLDEHQAGIDVNDYYRDRLTLDPLSALRGLGDRACEDDAGIAASHIDDTAPAIRVAALRLLARLGRGSDRDLFVERFVRGNSKERREALAGLRRCGGAEVVEDTWVAAMESGDPTMARRVLVQLVPLADRWLNISIGLQATAHSDPDISAAGISVLIRALNIWNRGYPTKPSVDGKVLRERFENARPALRSHASRWSRRDLEIEFERLLSRG